MTTNIRRYRKIADQIAEQIYSGHYQVGGRLPAERDLAASFSVGRPVLREAIIALELSGLLEVRQGAGIFVRSRESQPLQVNTFDPGVSPFELIDARILIEADVAEIAATLITDAEILAMEGVLQGMKDSIANADDYENYDRQFHLLVARAARNKALTAVIENLWNLHNRGRTWSQLHRIIPKDKLHGDRLDEHVAVYDALKARDPARARAAMLEHLERARDTLMEASKKMADLPPEKLENL